MLKPSTDSKLPVLSSLFQIGFAALFYLYCVFFDHLSALGIFSKYYAIIAITGQFLTFGFHDIQLGSHEKKHVDLKVFGAGGSLFRWEVLMLLIGAALCLAIGVDGNLVAIATASVLVCGNKIGFFFLSARGRSSAVHWLYMLRAAILFGTLVAVAEDLTAGLVIGCFIISEAIVFAATLLLLLHYEGVRTLSSSGSPFSFLNDAGAILPHTLFVDAFLRVDILCLSFFVDYRQLGLYALISTAFEANKQILYALKIRFASSIRRILALRRHSRAKIFKNMSRRYAFLATAEAIAFGAASLLGLEFAIRLGLLESDARTLFLIIFPGYLVYQSSFIFDMIFLQARRFLWQSAFTTSFMLLNLVSNILLIPEFGLAGAALATAITFAAYGVSVYFFQISFARKSNEPIRGNHRQNSPKPV